jgi:hypothetical protein
LSHIRKSRECAKIVPRSQSIAMTTNSYARLALFDNHFDKNSIQAVKVEAHIRHSRPPLP